jgi:hypothetical protein
MSFIKFYKNLEEFKKYEIEAGERIKTLYNTTIIKYNNNNKYDFKTVDNIKYEVKTEPTSLTTDNFFIEFFAYGKLSGISVTKSNFYIFSDTINFYLIDTNKLKNLIEKNTFKIVYTKDKLTKGYLINKFIIIKNSLSI